MAVDYTSTRSRRWLLTALLGGATAALTATLTGVQRAVGAGDEGEAVHVGDVFRDVRSRTGFRNASNDATVLAADTNDGIGVHGASDTRFGVLGTSSSGTGIEGAGFTEAAFGVHGTAPYVAMRAESIATGTTNGSGVGLFATSVADDGAGVEGRGPNIGVRGESAGIAIRGDGVDGGVGILGHSLGSRAVVGVDGAESGPAVGVMGESFSSEGTGVRGWASGDSTGVLGFSGASGVPDAQAMTGVYGYADQDAGSVGVRGASPTGRGGVFEGATGPLRLLPGIGEHPASGETGDLYVDSTGQLWFCRGADDWRQLA